MNAVRMITAALAFLLGPVSHAADLDLDILSISLSKTGKDLTVTFADKTPVPHACDLFVQRMEYRRELRSVLLDVQPSTPCFHDRFAKRKGKWVWQLPEGKRARAALRLSLNNKVVGQLSIESGSVTFRPTTE